MINVKTTKYWYFLVMFYFWCRTVRCKETVWFQRFWRKKHVFHTFCSCTAHRGPSWEWARWTLDLHAIYKWKLKTKNLKITALAFRVLFFWAFTLKIICRKEVGAIVCLYSTDHRTRLTGLTEYNLEDFFFTFFFSRISRHSPSQIKHDILYTDFIRTKTILFKAPQ